jgi:hypothetical protein
MIYSILPREFHYLSTQSKSENGDNIESVDSIKYFAPKVYASQYRAVTSNDYKVVDSIYLPKR